MAIQMTRAEYEAQYGVKPDVSSITPIKMTRAEYEQTYKEPVKQESILEKRGGSALDTLKNVATLQTSVPEGALQVVGQAAGGINDLIGKAISPVINYVTNKISDIPFVQRLSQAPSVSKALDITNETIGDVATQYKSWAEKYPNQAKDLESAVNIATLLPVGKGVGIAGKSATGELITTATKSAIGKVAEPLSASLKTSAEESIMKALGATTKENKAISAKLAPQILEKPMSETFALTRQGLQSKASIGKETAGQAIEEFGTLKGTTETSKIINALEAEKGQYIAGNVIVNPEAVSKILKVQGIISQYGTTIDNETLRAVNRIFGKEVAQSKGFALSPAEGTLIDIKKTAYGKIRAILAESQDDVFSKLNKEYSFWSDLEKVVGDTNIRTASQTGFGKDLVTVIGAASGDSALGIAVKALTFRWVSATVKSTGWRLVSARVKNNLADAIASGNWIAANEQLRELTKNSSFAKQWDKIKNTPNKQGGFINFDEINKSFQSQTKQIIKDTTTQNNQAIKSIPAKAGETTQSIKNNNNLIIPKSMPPSKIESSMVKVYRGQSHEGFTAFDGKTGKQRFMPDMKGTSFSKSKTSALNYGDKIVEGSIPKNQILTSADIHPAILQDIKSSIKNLTYDDYVDGIRFEYKVSMLSKIAKSKGKTAIDLTEFFPKSKIDSEIRVLSPDAFKVSSTQSSLLQEAKKYKSAETNIPFPEPKTINELASNAKVVYKDQPRISAAIDLVKRYKNGEITDSNLWGIISSNNSPFTPSQTTTLYEALGIDPMGGYPFKPLPYKISKQKLSEKIKTTLFRDKYGFELSDNEIKKLGTTPEKIVKLLEGN